MGQEKEARQTLQRSASAPVAGAAVRKSAADQLSRNVAQVVRGIVGYSRWPGGNDAEIQLCVLAPTAHLQALKFSYPLAAMPQQQLEVVQVRLEDVLGPNAGGCDAVYLGDIPAAARAGVLKELVGKPVLTISECSGHCNDGSLFCLRFAGSAVMFEVNLDSVARSGIRINPHVLKLSQAPEEHANP